MTVSNVDYQELDGDADDNVSLGKRFDLVKDVKVSLSVYVGDSEISVSSLFDLKNGSVVKLDRNVNAPLDIKYNGKVIARGELVAVDDNFGVKITQIEQ